MKRSLLGGVLLTLVLWPFNAAAADGESECIVPLIVSSEASQIFDVAALEDGRVVCLWLADTDASSRKVLGAYYVPESCTWLGVKPIVQTAGTVQDLTLTRDGKNRLWLFTLETDDSGATSVLARHSADEGSMWQEPVTLSENTGAMQLGTALALPDGSIAVAVVEQKAGGGGQMYLLSGNDEGSWRRSDLIALDAAAAAPALVARSDGLPEVYFRRADVAHRFLRASEGNGAEAVNLPYAGEDPSVEGAAFAPFDDGQLLAVLNDNVTQPGQLAFRLSYDQGRTWPVRRILATGRPGAQPQLVQTSDGEFHVFVNRDTSTVDHFVVTREWILAQTKLNKEPHLANVVPPLNLGEHRNRGRSEALPVLPVEDTPFVEHVRVMVRDDEWPAAQAEAIGKIAGVDVEATTPVVKQGGGQWIGTTDGLYSSGNGATAFVRYPQYGVNGPLANVISDLAVDSKDTLWVATPAGLSARTVEGAWELYRGPQGLPWEELTALAIGPEDELWIGSTRGLILFQPNAEGRQWYYRAGERYLPNDHVLEVAITNGGKTVYAKTEGGLGRIDAVPLTMYAKAEYLEARMQDRHLRLGMPSPAQYDDAYAMNSWTFGPQPSDGLWTSYHVAAMSMAYSLTQDERYKEAAKEGMEALYLLQNVTGIPGLVARTVVSVDEPYAEQARGQSNWHETADGRYLWRDDVSSDQIDGHYLGFYAYFEHIAQFDPVERTRLEKQMRQVTDFILDHNYQIIDWDGERTEWGWWNPESLNHDAVGYLESGLYSLMMLSFLKTAYYVTDEAAYLDHFKTLVEEHGYLSNLLLEKKLFPDELNHSDDQLSAVAYYPILQLEHEPFIVNALHRACRRHAFIELPEQNSFFVMTYASLDPEDADVLGAVKTLREMPRDRRDWAMMNSHRADVTWRIQSNRGGAKVLLNLLSPDERNFERWNQDPYEPDSSGQGRNEGSGEHYLLPYWMGRWHGMISPPAE